MKSISHPSRQGKFRRNKSSTSSDLIQISKEHKTINEAILELAVDTKSSFCPIWQIFLVVPFYPLRYSCQLVCSVQIQI